MGSAYAERQVGRALGAIGSAGGREGGNRGLRGKVASGKAWELVGIDLGRDANGTACCASFRGSLRPCLSPFHSWHLAIRSRAPSR